MELVANIEKSLNHQLLACAKAHHIKKNEFIRQAIIGHIENLSDMDLFEQTKKDPIYSLAAVEKAIGMED